MLDIADIVGKFTSIMVKKLSMASEELAHQQLGSVFLIVQLESRDVATAVTGGSQHGASCSLDDLPQHLIRDYCSPPIYTLQQHCEFGCEYLQKVAP